MRLVLGVLLAGVLAGCGMHVPFQETELVPFPHNDPQAVVEQFRANIPLSFQLLSTVVFEYNSRKISGIGSLEAVTTSGTFKLAAMNGMGVKLFELSGDRKSITTDYVIAALNRYGDITTAVGNDIRRIYFDLVPGPEATVWKRKNKLVFRQPSGQGFLEYIFAGEHGDLIEKNYYEDRGILWRVSYYEYHDENGKRLPHGVLFVHYDYGYRLTVRHKEFHLENNKS